LDFFTSGESSESAALYEFDRADILVGGMRWQERKHRKKSPAMITIALGFMFPGFTTSMTSVS
jgi:hypothetical protein